MSKAVVIPECNKDIGGIKEEISLSPSEKKDGPIGLLSRLLRRDSLGKRNSAPGSPTSTEPRTTYYGVYIPCEIKKGPDEEALHVYKNKIEALELVRRYKLARFKAFQNRQDAISFALKGAEPVDTTDGNDNFSALMGEKPYPFKAPSPQDMVALRKAIEAGLSGKVHDCVWDNPRYLVSSGNTPAIMQEGSRYNALHIAAKVKNAEICNLILTTVGDSSFVQKLYGTDADPDSCKEFASILVDRYLNTPDKAMNETPLHFAAKFGAEDVVDVLTSFPQCNRTAVNKFGEQPKDIICVRVTGGTSANGESTRRISVMLQERYYVPVLHAEDGTATPTIGRPFTPAVPPEINNDLLSPRYEIRAFAGPMEADDAEKFRRRWKTPPRSPIRLATPTFRLKDMTKGLEVVGRNLAEQMKIGWKEYWPFLDTFTDLRTSEGLILLENYLKAKYLSAYSFIYNDSCAQSQMTLEDLSISRLNLSNITQSSPLKETSVGAMSELCVAMKTCTISDRPHWRRTDPIRRRLCRQPNVKSVDFTNGESTPIISHTVSQLLCIERTCQVFAKRIADSLTFSVAAEPKIADHFLKAEVKHLRNTIFTYMDDERFQNINFALIHSRLAQLVVYMLKQRTKDSDFINSLVEILVKLPCPNESIFSSDDESKPFTYKGSSRVKITNVIDCHVRCLASFISGELTDTEICKGPSVSESECKDVWDKAAKCRCDCRMESFDRNSKKNTSLRKNISILSTSPKNDSFVRRLTFDHDIGDGRVHGEEIEKPVSVNSPAGDSGAFYTIDVAKCQVVQAEQISDDESDASDSDADSYRTASDHDEDMHDASDVALANPFIYGEEPSKMDRLVYEAISQCRISADQFPYIYHWRHIIELYTPEEREKWQTVVNPEGSASVCVSPNSTPRASVCVSPNSTPRASVCVSPNSTPRADRASRPHGTLASPALFAPLAQRHSTPNKDSGKDDTRTLPLQVSNWLRVTGPNSPRSSLVIKNAGHNVSFGF